MNPSSDKPKGKRDWAYRWLDSVLASSVKATAKVVGAYLFNRADQQGVCYPSIATIATGCRLSRRMVTAALAELAPFLDRMPRAGAPCRDGRNRTDLFRLRVQVAHGHARQATPRASRLRKKLHQAAQIPARKPRTSVRIEQPIEQLKNKTVTRASARNHLWETVCEVFHLKPVTQSDRTRVGRVVRDLKAKGATEDEVKLRAERYRRAWPNCECTPEALLKHWDRFAKDEAPQDRRGRVEAPPGKYTGLKVVGVHDAAG